ncbi:MAG: NAD-dependent epimerase/dehydratase family protein [Candidatus Kapabacteria bacterium]|nr:NAD-dependent epimerase/dehydratase family protein [Candidatus Kapabacteria bacterium]
MKKILVTGALGQIGTELVRELRLKYGHDNVIASDKNLSDTQKIKALEPFEYADVTNAEELNTIIERHNIDSVFHLAAILSAVGERNPMQCWNVNMTGTLNILEIGVAKKLNRIIIPSSMAVWGDGVSKDMTPQESVLRPTTMYGLTKVCGERLCDYYFLKYGLDTRGLRYPGIISSETLPGGGTTDYAVDIFYKAVKDEDYSCFLSEGTMLPMMYMPDCLKATIDLAEADVSRLQHHSDFNVASFSFNPAQLTKAIQKHKPDFKVVYEPDFRQSIADSWPRTIDDSAARAEWGWQPAYSFEDMVTDMLNKLSQKLK